MKKLEISLFLGLVLSAAALFAGLPFASACSEVREDTLRLHVVADSDSERDQAVKLEVRDAVVGVCADLFAGAGGYDGAVQRAGAALPEIERAANAVLAAEGFEYRARAELKRMYFDARSYGEVTLPSGVYTALRVTLGKGEGKNWWCVLYPALCIASSSADALEEYSEQERTVVLGGERYAVRFKLEEWFRELFGEDGGTE